MLRASAKRPGEREVRFRRMRCRRIRWHTLDAGGTAPARRISTPSCQPLTLLCSLLRPGSPASSHGAPGCQQGSQRQGHAHMHAPAHACTHTHANAGICVHARIPLSTQARHVRTNAHVRACVRAMRVTVFFFPYCAPTAGTAVDDAKR